MFCPNCGKKIEDDSKFCIYCGNEVINFYKDDTVDIIEESMKDVSDVVMQSIENTKESNFDDSGTSTNVGQDPKTERKNTIIGLAIICLAVFLLIKGCGAIWGGSKGEKIAKNLVSAKYLDCDIKSVTKVVESSTGPYYVVKFTAPGEEEHAVLVWVDNTYKFANIDSVYSKSHYDELNSTIELYKKFME